MRFAVIACATILLCGCATANGSRSLTIGVCAADLGATAYGLHHGYSEANPVYGGAPIPKAIALNVLYVLAIDRMTRGMGEGDRKIVWEWSMLVRAVPVIWNLVQIERAR